MLLSPAAFVVESEARAEWPRTMDGFVLLLRCKIAKMRYFSVVDESLVALDGDDEWLYQTRLKATFRPQ